jgi:hypothetical protein
LLDEAEAAGATRGRLLSLLRSHVRLSTGIRNVAGTVCQSGFETLFKMRETGEVPSCPVCLEPCDPACVAACAHFYCRLCVATMISASGGRALCAICRRAVSADKVVEIQRSSIGRKGKNKAGHADDDDDDDDDDDVVIIDDCDDGTDDDDDVVIVDACDDENDNLMDGKVRADKGSSDSATRNGTVSSDSDGEADAVAAGGAGEPSAIGPRFAAALWEEYQALGEAPAEYAGLGYNPGTPSLDRRFLCHLACSQAEPAKFHALADLIASEPADVKFVVVAEAANTLQACGRWLQDHRDIQCVGVGMDAAVAASRVHANAAHEFKTNPEKRVFLLNTSSASGLTLTAASFVVFLEPLARRADEIQASARVHRIGQTKEVHIVRMVTTNSVERDLIAARGGQASATSSEEAAALAAVSSPQATDEMILGVFGWERTANGLVRRLRTSAKGESHESVANR